MKKIALLNLLLLMYAVSGRAQNNLYFPPLAGTAWDTVAPSSLGWCTDNIDSLYDYLEGENTKAFIVLKDGKIALERYFGTFTRDSIWYWASAGKTLTGMAVGIAQAEGSLSINDTSSTYLGQGWTACTSTQEARINIRHQLSMSSGLDDAVPDNHCTLDTCMRYRADAGTRWAYHNAPYTMLDAVIETATGSTLNSYINQRIKQPTGMSGVFVSVDYDNVFYSKARSMARFGLLLLNKGKWNNTEVLSDTSYFRQMTNSSQTLNPSYGYLCWLNGKSSFRLPSSQISFQGWLCPHAPQDMYAAIGKNGQIISVVPSQSLVLVRMGNAPDSYEVPITLTNEIWARFNSVACNINSNSSINEVSLPDIFPNPAAESAQIIWQVGGFSFSLYDMAGRVVVSGTDFSDRTSIDTHELPTGIYVLKLLSKQGKCIVHKLSVSR